MRNDQERLAWINAKLTETCSMEEMWREFRDAVLDGLSPTVHAEMRKAFFAGAICLFDIINFMGKQQADAELMGKLILSLKAEFTRFSEEQIRGAYHREDQKASGDRRTH